MIDKLIIERMAANGPADESVHLMVPQEGVRHTVFPPEVKHNAIWDYDISPDGRHYFSLCAEGDFSQYVHLYEYLPERGEFKRLFKLDDVAVTNYRAIRPSKFHSSFSFLPDGRLIMNAHTTAISPLHPTWMPFPYYNHIWEGYAGSYLLIYDPKTGKVDNRGIPVPRETVYGGVYEPTTNAYYFGGYMRGHVYKYELDNCHVTDYGQATEYGSFRYIVGPDSNVYVSSKSGYFLRINTKENKVEDLKQQFPVYDHLPGTLTHNQMLFGAHGPDGCLYISAAYGDQMLKYDYAANEISQVGYFVPEPLRGFHWTTQAIAGMAFDAHGVLWYGCQVGQSIYLVSWDFLKGGAPVNWGIMGSPQRRIGYLSELHIRDDVLYAADTNHDMDPPGIFSIKLQSLRACAQAREMSRDPYHYLYFKDGAKHYPGDLEKDAARHYAQQKIGDEHQTINRSNPYVFSTKEKYLTKLWRNTREIEDSSVQKVWFDANGDVHAICGAQWFTHFKVRDGVILDKEEGVPYTPVDREALAQAHKDFNLPSWPGRKYKAVANAVAQWKGEKKLIGTLDGLLAIVDGNSVFALGPCAPNGPVHDIAVMPDLSFAVGVAGDENDLGTVFIYDDQEGLRILGRVYISSYESVGGLGASCEPYTVAISEDGKRIAIGARDRLGCLYEYCIDGKPGVATMF